MDVKMNIFRKFISSNNIPPLHFLRRVARVQHQPARSGSNVGEAVCIYEAPKLDNQKVVLTQREKLDRERHKNQISVCGQPSITSLTGVPKAHIHSRRVRIYEVFKNAMQSGTNTVKGFKLQFETRERWENPLMGWASSGDPLGGMNLWFPTEKEAIAFCDKNEWRWFLEHRPNKPVKKALRPGSYASNYSWDKRTRKGMK